MLTGLTPDNADTVPASAESSAGFAWWARLLARVPLGALYRLADLLGWLAFRVFHYREHVVRENLSTAFPQFNQSQLRAVIRSYYLGFAQMLVEVIKSVSIPAAEIRRRVRVVNLEAPRALLAQGQSVLLVAAHQCNWEWMLLALSLELGYPLDAAYKPLVDNWAEREMKKVRTRFGSRLVPAKELLADILQRRGVVRTIAIVADQEPTTSEHKHWTRFLNRDTAFFMGPEEIARVTHFPVFFLAMRRTGRGYYEMEFQPLAGAAEALPPGALTERYVRRVEEQIRAAPPDWPWSHKRWKLRKSVYQQRRRA
ncbi:MAG TPA: lysophospholipid acyltransferase family protein [Steroidobacteraceae bacterium]|jgi:KDO2-lipid IV(A) lauroyltransferase|nr:lysophospholipid acyltransferase family protein [Steroidobacteraceae bacterium]